MWIEILTVVLFILFILYVGNERDKHTRRNAPAKIQLKVEQVNEVDEN